LRSDATLAIHVEQHRGVPDRHGSITDHRSHLKKPSRG
jgi:hypothetical protein